MKSRQYIRIKRAIFSEKDIVRFIEENSKYRINVWNDFVSAYYTHHDSNFDTEFDVDSFKKRYFYECEMPNNAYNKYAVGISEQVAKDIKRAINVCNKQNGKLRYKTFDMFRHSFNVHTKPIKVKRKDKKIPPRFNSRVYIDSDNQITFRVRNREELFILLKEPLMRYPDSEIIGNDVYYFDKKFRYAFSEMDIKEISFSYELGVCFITLAIDAILLYNKNDELHRRIHNAGIDLGIRNPISIYDDNSTMDIHTIVKMPKSVEDELIRLEKRISRLQDILQTKTEGSNNYYKVLKKIRITGKRMHDIRMNWRKQTSCKIAKRYDNICVDTFETPDNKDFQDGNIKHQINKSNRRYGMYLFSESLKHACIMYDTSYIESPDNSTRTCCVCKHINKPIPLTQTMLICEKCGNTINRDHNASKNCYDYISKI